MVEPARVSPVEPRTRKVICVSDISSLTPGRGVWPRGSAASNTSARGQCDLVHPLRAHSRRWLRRQHAPARLRVLDALTHLLRQYAHVRLEHHRVVVARHLVHLDLVAPLDRKSVV